MTQPSSAHQMAEALEHYATGLRLSFYGLLMLTGGLIGTLPWLVAPLLHLDRKDYSWIFGPSVALAVIGSFVTMWGKYRCFEFPLPLSGRWLLSVAIGCDGIMLTTRLVSRLVPIFKLFRMAEPILLLVGLVFFLLFLRSLADVIQRTDLKRSAAHVLGVVGLMFLTLLLFLVGSALRKTVPGLAIPLVFILCLSLLSVVLFEVLYARLLWKMSLGLADFAKYLKNLDHHLGTGEEDSDMPDEERDSTSNGDE